MSVIVVPNLLRVEAREIGDTPRKMRRQAAAPTLYVLHSWVEFGVASVTYLLAAKVRGILREARLVAAVHNSVAGAVRVEPFLGKSACLTLERLEIPS